MKMMVIRIWTTKAMMLLSKFIVLIIRLYQRCFSPALGFFTANRCRYVPSCSDYGIQAIEKFGFFKGVWLSLKRIIRCNPWGGSGHDPVP